MGCRVLGVITAGLLGAAQLAAAQPLGTAFTHQGHLADGGSPASGPYDFRCILYDAPAGGSQVGPIVPLDDVAVANGLFTIALDFGPSAFRGDARWLEIAVRPGASTGAYTIVGGRQEIRPAPNAIFSTSSAAANAAPWSGVTGKPAGFADDVDDDSGGTVTGVATGAGLTGGPITASGTVSVATGGITTALLAGGAVTAAKIANGAVGVGQIDTTQVQARVAGVCPLGSYLRGINADGTVVCTGIPNPHTSTNVHVLPSFDIGRHSSIAVPADGRPVVAYQNTTTARLTSMRCGNAACSTGNLVRELDGGNQVGLYTSIAIGSDGFPVIAYHDETAGTLKVAKCTNPGCASGTIVTTVDDQPGNTVGLDTSIAIGADGFPVISYYDSTAGGLKVAKCVNVNCTGLNTITMLHNPAADVGRDTAIAVGSDGLPVIAFRDFTAGMLNVAKCASAACNTGATITALAPAAGGRLDLALGADGLPVISFERTVSQNSEIRVVKCGNPACTAGNTNNLVYLASGLGGADSSIAIAGDGLPIISHWGPQLRVSKCGDAACGSGNILSVLDGPQQASVGLMSSIAVGPDGLAVVSHYNSTEKALRISKCGNLACN